MRCIFSCITNSQLMLKLLIVDMSSSSLFFLSVMVVLFSFSTLAFIFLTFFFIMHDNWVFDGTFDLGWKIINILGKSFVGWFDNAFWILIIFLALRAVFLTSNLIDGDFVLVSSSGRNKRSSHNSDGSFYGFTTGIIVNVFELSKDWNFHLYIFLFVFMVFLMMFISIDPHFSVIVFMFTLLFTTLLGSTWWLAWFGLFSAVIILIFWLLFVIIMLLRGLLIMPSLTSLGEGIVHNLKATSFMMLIIMAIMLIVMPRFSKDHGASKDNFASKPGAASFFIIMMVIIIMSGQATIPLRRRTT
jgi:hypothetical protein